MFRAWMLWATLLTLLANQSVQVLAQEADASEPAAKSESEPAESLSSVQEGLAMRFQRFENTMLQVAEYLRKTDPERADLLVRAIGRSKEARLPDQFTHLINLLKQEQLGDAVGEQEHVVVLMQGLLELLQSEDRKDEIEKEKARIRDLIKDVDRLLDKQTDLRADTERKENPDRLKNRQEKLTEDTQKLVDKIDGQDAAKAAAKAQKNAGKSSQKPGSPSKDGEPKDGAESKDGSEMPQDGENKPEGETKDSEPKNGDSKPPGDSQSGEPKDGQKNSDGQPKEGAKPKDGSKPKDGDKPPVGDQPKEGDKPQDGDQPMDGAESSPSEGEKSKSQKGKPQKSKPGKSKSQPGKSGQPPEGDDSPPQQDQSQQSEDEPASQRTKTAGREEIQRAKEDMERAIEELKKKNQGKASDEQDRAIAELMKAKEKLEEILRQLREEEKEMLLAALEARFRDMLQRETMIYNGTVGLHAVPETQRSDRHRNRSVELARSQDEVALLAAKALTLLKEEGSSIAFPEAVEQMRDDMLLVVGRLERFEVGELTQGIERDIMESLEELIEALQQEMEKAKDKKNNPQQQQQQPQDPPLVDQLAELKTLRALQFRVNRRTKVLGREVEGEQAVEPDLIKQLREQARRQEKIQRATYDLSTGKNK